MLKRFPILALTALVLAATFAMITVADAQGRAERRFLRGFGVGVGVGAGLLFGAAAARALAPAYRPYAPIEGYVYYPGFAGPIPIDCPGGFWARRCRATDAFGNCMAWSGPRFFCPPPGYAYY
jgi:hypothetical protein